MSWAGVVQVPVLSYFSHWSLQFYFDRVSLGTQIHLSACLWFKGCMRIFLAHLERTLEVEAGSGSVFFWIFLRKENFFWWAICFLTHAWLLCPVKPQWEHRHSMFGFFVSEKPISCLELDWLLWRLSRIMEDLFHLILFSASCSVVFSFFCKAWFFKKLEFKSFYNSTCLLSREQFCSSRVMFSSLRDA